MIDYSQYSSLYKSPDMESVSPIVRACLKLGEREHGNTREDKRYRKKLPPHEQMPAWTHLILTYNILQHFNLQEKFPHRWQIILGAALLHDLHEDTHLASQSSSSRALQDTLMEENIPKKDAGAFAKDITKIVEELTNIDGDNMDKRLWQVDHASVFSEEAKIIKYAEFCASMVDDVFFPSKSGKDWCINFANKSQSLAYAMSSNFETQAKLAIALCEAVKKYHSEPHEGDDLEYKKDILRGVIKQAETVELPKMCDDKHFTFVEPMPENGIFATAKNEKGEVTHFVVSAAPDKYWLISNQYMNNLVSLIEDVSKNLKKGKPLNHMYEGPIHSFANSTRCGRCVALARPIPEKEFLEIAEEAKKVKESRLEQRAAPLPPTPESQWGVWPGEHTPPLSGDALAR